MVYHRGNRLDYDRWAEEGCEGWSWKDVLPFFLKSEDNLDPDIAANTGTRVTSLLSLMMVETRSGKMQDPAQERIQAEESAKPQPGATIGRDASSDPVVLNPNIDIPNIATARECGRQIPVVADLPVGDNLQEHPGTAGLYYTVNISLPYTRDDLISEFQSYVFKPEVLQVYNEVYAPYNSLPGFTLFPYLLRPKSRGTIRLKSADPYDHPLIDPQTFADLADLEALVEGIKIVKKLGDSEPFKKLGTRMVDIPPKECRHLPFFSDDYLRCYIRFFTITVYHPVGTCKMGPASDPAAVVDPQLRTCIKFCVENEIKCADAFRMLTVAYGEATLDRSNVYRWYKMFSEGRENVNDEERARRPSTSTTDEKINEVEKMILANRRITVREVAEDLNISIGSCHSIFINDLGMRRVAAKFVPKLLNCDQKQHRMNIANEMLDSVRDDPNLLQRVITGDEAGVVHHEFLPQGRTVNKEYYLQIMRNLREAIRQKRPDLWKNKNWLLHHDNAPAHTSLLVRDFLAKNNTLMMPQPPYSPDLAPCDFFLFPKLKRPMKGRRYATLDEIKTASKEELKKILKNDFLKCFEDWKNRWHKCIISHGDYFEGDKIDIHE
ncbi:hypothetical protein LAZ67_5000695 [Cordylochernes scorpioides]|uniref:Glucose-methanol-choline oxidoreductase C-terminal domain-containing protein n=1 Tax=Cordylochernes scorpioides TaxID=51811 RepID=A0ABY6KIM0_9ARAC|nr:hypothetical protein LAZ67_5000695 [Cordylochernes scorpioides]